MRPTSNREQNFDVRDLDGVRRWVSDQPPYASFTFVRHPGASVRESYLDTRDWDVYRAGFSLRIRRQDEVELVHLTPERNSKARPEQIESVEAYSRHDKDPGGIAEKVELITSGAPLLTVFQAETSRDSLLIEQDGTALAALNLDSTRVHLPGAGEFALARVAVEEVAPGGLDRTERLVEALVTACNLQATHDTLFAAALHTAGLVPDLTFDFGHSELYADATAGEYAYASLRRSFAAFLSREPGARLGEDPEELHDMRVAARRTRAVLSVFRPVLPLRFSSLGDELKWISAALGEVRDQDVRLEWFARVRSESDWQEGVSVGPLIEIARDARAAARAGLLTALAGERYRMLVAGMGQALRAGEVSGPAATTPVRGYAARTLRKRYRRFRRSARELRNGSPISAYHALRIAGKRLRYSLECLEVVLSRPSRRLIRATRRAQDYLGEHQDCAVTAQWLLDTTSERGADLPPATLMRMGELLALQRSRMAEIRGRWPDAQQEVREAWRALRKTLKPEATREAPKPGARPTPERPVQRPLGLFQRFLPQGRDGKA